MPLVSEPIARVGFKLSQERGRKIISRCALALSMSSDRADADGDYRERCDDENGEHSEVLNSQLTHCDKRFPELAAGHV